MSAASSRKHPLPVACRQTAGKCPPAASVFLVALVFLSNFPLRAQQSVEERFLRALSRGDVTTARARFIEAQPDAARVLERALVFAPVNEEEIVRRSVSLLQAHVRNFALSEIAAMDRQSLSLLYPVKEAARLKAETQDMEGARRDYLTALQISRAGSWRWQEQRFLFLIADTHSQAGEPAEARRWLAMAASLESPARPTHLDAMAHEHLGENLLGAGDVNAALRHFLRALQVYAAIEYPEGIAIAANNLATLFFDSGNYAAALDYYRQSLGFLRRDDPNRAVVRHNIVDCLLELDRRDEAAELLRERTSFGSTAYFQQLGLRARWLRAEDRGAEAAALAARGLREAIRSGSAEFISDLLRDLIRVELSARNAEQAALTVLPRLGETDRNRWDIHWRLAQAFAREDDWRRVEAYARQSFMDLRRTGAGDDFEFNFSARALQAARLWSLALVRQNRTRAALTVWERAKAFALRRAFKPLRQVQESLGPQCIVLDFCVTERVTLVWLVTRDSVECHVLEVSEQELSQQVAALLGPFMSPRNLLEPLYRQDLSQVLYRRLALPLEPALGAMHCWTLLPDGALHALPFEMLESGDGRAIEERASLRYWQTLASHADPPRRLSGLTALADNPDQEAAFLPESARRVRSWDDALQGGGDMLHFGGHSFQDRTYPARSSLALTAEISAGQISRSRVPYRLVVLGSCESAGGVGGFGAGLTGLASAFQEAGARQIVATLWPIDRHSTEIFREFYSRADSESDLAEGLRLARSSFRGRVFRVGSYDVPMSSPYFWAPFVLIAPHDPHPARPADHSAGILFSFAVLSTRCCIRKAKRRNR